MFAFSQSGYNFFPLKDILLWFDPVRRTGVEAMAVDEALLTYGAGSVLRVYQWLQPTVTYGYFDKECQARELFDDGGVDFVRRWTGGGIVDHRYDIPYTLVLKREGRIPSTVLYRWIHGGLAKTLRFFNIEAVLLANDVPDGGRVCFSSPVTSDLVLPNGDKLAGAGQRRSKHGVLHQGSIQNCSLPEEWAEKFALRLSEAVCTSKAKEPFEGFDKAVKQLVDEKYSTDKWKSGSRK